LKRLEDNIKINIVEAGRVNVGSFPVAGFGISGVEPWGHAAGEPFVHSECLAGNMKPFGGRD
jgi:hypothetical protein